MTARAGVPARGDRDPAHPLGLEIDSIAREAVRSLGLIAVATLLILGLLPAMLDALSAVPR